MKNKPKKTVIEEKGLFYRNSNKDVIETLILHKINVLLYSEMKGSIICSRIFKI